MSYFAFSRLVVVVCGLFCWAILRLMDYIVILGKNILDMKKFGFLILVAAACALVACNEKPNKGEAGDYTLSWDLQTVLTSGGTVDSVVMAVNGKHVQTLTDAADGIYKFEGTAEDGAVAKVTAYINHSEFVANVLAALEAGTISVDNDTQCAVGTPINDDVRGMVSSFLNDQTASALASYIADNAADLRALLVLGNEAVRSMSAPTDMQKLFEQMSPKLKNSAYGKEIKVAIDKTCSTLAGAKFVDFAATYNGKTQRLSDYVGKGKLVVADFWASWCGTCRKEIPNLINIHEKYGDKVLVLGIATWDNPEDTEKAIAELKIPYPQMLNTQKAGSDAYSITGIPEIIVFAPDGTILHRGLRGQELENAVVEYLQTHP